LGRDGISRWSRYQLSYINALGQNLPGLRHKLVLHVDRLPGDLRPPSRLISHRCVLAAALVTVLVLVPIPAVTVSADAPSAKQNLQQQVATTERAFAKTMADRDLPAFGRFISQEAVFVSGAKSLRGRQQVIDGWRKLYAGPSAPFSWEPETVEVLDSGQLALSSGPVHDAAGKLVGKFTSIWRLEAPNTWRIVFDSGCDVCPRCAADTG
jgi:ketosteroid isomerase-like protein